MRIKSQHAFFAQVQIGRALPLILVLGLFCGCGGRSIVAPTFVSARVPQVGGTSHRLGAYYLEFTSTGKEQRIVTPWPPAPEYVKEFEKKFGQKEVRLEYQIERGISKRLAMDLSIQTPSAVKGGIKHQFIGEPGSHDFAASAFVEASISNKWTGGVNGGLVLTNEIIGQDLSLGSRAGAFHMGLGQPEGSRPEFVQGQTFGGMQDVGVDPPYGTYFEIFALLETFDHLRIGAAYRDMLKTVFDFPTGSPSNLGSSWEFSPMGFFWCAWLF